MSTAGAYLKNMSFFFFLIGLADMTFCKVCNVAQDFPAARLIATQRLDRVKWKEYVGLNSRWMQSRSAGSPVRACQMFCLTAGPQINAIATIQNRDWGWKITQQKLFTSCNCHFELTFLFVIIFGSENMWSIITPWLNNRWRRGWNLCLAIWHLPHTQMCSWIE